MKRLFLFILVLPFFGCSGIDSSRCSLPVLLNHYELPLPVENKDQGVIGNFFLLRGKDKSYISLSVESVGEEWEKYGMNSVDLVRQLYGFENPGIEEIAEAKKMLFNDVFQHKPVDHDTLVAFFLKDTAGVERIYFADPNSPSEYYLLESKGRGLIEIFNGIRTR